MSGVLPVIPREALGGVYFDGLRAEAQAVRLVLDRTTRQLLMRRDGEGDVAWSFDDIRLVPDQAGERGLVLRNARDPAARLLTAHREIAEDFPE